MYLEQGGPNQPKLQSKGAFHSLGKIAALSRLTIWQWLEYAQGLHTGFEFPRLLGNAVVAQVAEDVVKVGGLVVLCTEPHVAVCVEPHC